MLLERGKPYPLPLGTREGAAAQFLMRGGSVLQVVLPGMTAHEEKALRSGVMQAGMLREADHILLLFRFLDERGPVLTLDAPFDVRLLPAEQRELPSTETPTAKLLVQLHGVDDQSILRVLRGISLSAGLTRAFLSAAMDQLATPPNHAPPPAAWSADPADLVRFCDLSTCGR